MPDMNELSIPEANPLPTWRACPRTGVRLWCVQSSVMHRSGYWQNAVGCVSLGFGGRQEIPTSLEP
jgi:hypothetical protein